MNEFMIYTSEGFTKSPENIEIENYQLLGKMIAEDEKQAKNLLKKNNPWIEEIGFDIDKAFVQQVFTPENQQDLKTLLDYMWKDEEKNFEECNYSKEHIFRIMLKLKRLCGY